MSNKIRNVHQNRSREDINGWDFSHVQTKTVGEKWDFANEIIHRCQPADIALDTSIGIQTNAKWFMIVARK